MTKQKRRVFTVIYSKRYNEWQIREAARSRWGSAVAIPGPFGRQREAIAKGRVIAKKHQPSQLVIRRKNGRILTEYTYGADPRRHPG